MGEVRNGMTGENAGLMNKLRNGAASQLDAQKARASDGINSVAQAVRQSTQQLRDNQHDVIARYVEQAVDRVERVADQLKQKDVNELARNAQQFARRNPAIFVGAAFGVGIVAARFLKSSHRNGASSSAGWRERTSGGGVRSYPSAAQSYRGQDRDAPPAGSFTAGTERF